MECASFVQNGVLKSSEISWPWSHRTCKAKLYSIGSDYLIVKKDMNQTDEIDANKTNRQVVSASVERKATEDLHKSYQKSYIESYLPIKVTHIFDNYFAAILSTGEFNTPLL